MQQGNITGSLETQSTTHKSSLLAMLRRHPLIFYFLFAYAISWGIGFPLILLLHTPTMLMLAILVASGPTISSFIMTAATQGRSGVGQLLRRYVRWRVGLGWYLFVLLVVPVLIALTALFLPGGIASLLQGLPSYPQLYVLVFFVGGPFLEEPGWRGFALPRVQQRFGPLRGSLLLGFLWGIWHLPLFLIPGYNGAGTGFIGISTALLAFAVGTSFVSIIFAWVSNNARGSLLLVMLLHASINTAGSLLPSSQNLFVSLVTNYAVFAGLAVIIIIVTRGRLSYDPSVYQIAASQADPVGSNSTN